jgi:calcium-dependent protein kinase
LHGDIKLENILLYTASKNKSRRFTSINVDINQIYELRQEINSRSNSVTKRSQNYVTDMMNYEIKLIDFGCSKYFVKQHKHQKLSGIIGSALYCSPEVVDNLYDEKSDEWSCGVLMYILLSGEAPFKGATDEEIFAKIKKCQYNFDLKEFKNVSENCKDLIRKLLEPKKKKRIKAADALKHPFFREFFNPSEAMTEFKDLNILKKLLQYKRPISKFHEAMHAFICNNFISKDEEKKLRAVFRYMDYDGKSFLTKSKIEKALKDNGNLITVYKIQNIIEALDFDKNGVIEYQEYIQGLCNKNALFNEFNLKNVFVLLDTDNKGYLTSTDIKNFAFPEKTVNDEAIKEYLKQFGMKIDDKLSFDDFVYIIQNNCSLNLHDFSKKQSQKSLGVENEIDLSLYTNENEGSEISDNEANGQDSKEKVNLRSPICLIKK